MAARIDLHAHTVVSDGTLTPTQLVERAKAAGLAALAVTDHDHVGGIAEARAAGARLGVEIVPGIELSVTHPAGEFHLLGYLFDPSHPGLLAALEDLRNHRSGRAARMVERLQALGVDITMEDVAREAGEGSVGRPHVARALMRTGYVGSIQEAFDRWLAEGRPAAVEKKKLDAAQALRLVHDAGGVAVLAHPVTVRPDARDALVRELAALGLDGIEVTHSKHGPAERETFARLAGELALVPTGGSDFHGDNKPDVALGEGKDGNVAVTMETLDALKRRAEARRSAR